MVREDEARYGVWDLGSGALGTRLESSLGLRGGGNTGDEPEK